MAIPTFRCGDSSSLLSQETTPQASRQNVSSPRLSIPLHVPPLQEVAHAFRVIAELARGRFALVCLGQTRQEALAGAWRCKGDLPAGTCRLRLQQWIGSYHQGAWIDLPSKRRELPQPRTPLRRCRRTFV
jgi:hypothetical protein